MTIITFGGTPGSGKGTVGQELAKILGIPFFSMGDLRRQYALEHGMSLADLNALSEKSPDNDKMVDSFQSKFPEKYESFIMDSRLGFHFIPSSVKIFLKVDIAEAAKRIMSANRDSEKMPTMQEGIAAIESRIRSDLYRYEKYYSLNPYDESNYDLIIDTTRLTPEQVLDIILEFIQSTGTKVKHQ